MSVYYLMSIQIQPYSIYSVTANMPCPNSRVHHKIKPSIIFVYKVSSLYQICSKITKMQINNGKLKTK